MSLLIAIGGALDIATPSDILHQFYRRAGGADGRVVIIPTASSDPHQVSADYAAALAALGLARPPHVLHIERRAQALAPHAADLEALQAATGLFLTGGNQVRLTAILGGTPIEGALHAAWGRGAVVMGSSAGTAVLSGLMLAYGESGLTPVQGMAHFAAGFGLEKRLVFDQHFRQRQRLGRLLYAVAGNPRLLGVGVDEDTAAVIAGDTLTVWGAQAVTIVDGRGLTFSDVAEQPVGHPITIAGAVVQTLTAGESFTLPARA